MTPKEEAFYSNSEWYHATSLKEWKSLCNIGICSDYNIGISTDFGNGFYLSNDVANTERYIKNVMKYSNDESFIPVIITFEFKPIDWIMEGYNFRHFPKYDDIFAEYVFKRRLNPDLKILDADMTSGVTTDAKPTLLMQAYEMGEITKEEVIEAFKTGTSIRQLCLHNQVLCDKIKPIKAEILNGKELNVNEYNS